MTAKICKLSVHSYSGLFPSVLLVVHPSDEAALLEFIVSFCNSNQLCCTLQQIASVSNLSPGTTLPYEKQLHFKKCMLTELKLNTIVFICSLALSLLMKMKIHKVSSLHQTWCILYVFLLYTPHPTQPHTHTLKFNLLGGKKVILTQSFQQLLKILAALHLPCTFEIGHFSCEVLNVCQPSPLVGCSLLAPAFQAFSPSIQLNAPSLSPPCVQWSHTLDQTLPPSPPPLHTPTSPTY